MSSPQSAAERTIISISAIIMPIIFIAQIALGIYISLLSNFMQLYSLLGVIVVWLQYSICIIFFRDHFKTILHLFVRDWRNVPIDVLKAKEEKFLFALSLNPFYGVIVRFFKFSVPIIEGLYILYIIACSLYWKRNMDEFLDLDYNERSMILSFFILSWSLLAFPLTCLLVAISLMIILGIPLILHEVFRKKTPEEIERQKQRLSIRRIIQTFVGAQRYQVEQDQIQKVEQCAICLNNFKQKEVVVSLRCHEAHVFHEDCLNKWSQSNLICPLCRVHLQIIHVVDELGEKQNQNGNNNNQQLIDQQAPQMPVHLHQQTESSQRQNEQDHNNQNPNEHERQNNLHIESERVLIDQNIDNQIPIGVQEQLS